MHGSLFARFRGADGRSLVRALVVLLLANAIVAGIHIAPASAATATICSVAASTGNGGAPLPGGASTGNGGAPLPGGASDHPCCAAGCMPAALGAPDAPEITLPAPGFARTVAPIATALPRTFAAPAPPARGPPSLA